ncbi:MAG: glycosyltransferase family 39 protein [SAR324 cluster bacterium]|nr:glycosyltransferase family 39 protein [SAR324 cluster bacterium]
MLYSNRNELLWFIGLTVFATLFLVLGLDAAPLIDWDENIYAEASRQMIERGDYLNIYINSYPFAEKPPFFFWMVSVSYHLFGINEFGARFPSAFSGVLSVWMCFYFGTKVKSFRLGILWGLIYLTSFLPSIFARSAVIDHTFNLFIMLSTFSLYAYDVRYKRFLSLEKNSRDTVLIDHWMLLTIASISMGLGVLTKGPLAGVIPLVGYGFFKVIYPYPRISWLHFFFCGALSLSVALSWYIANWWVHGFKFIEDFIGFQMALFSKPLEGNERPFYYHFVVALVGIFPWTPFLFLFNPGHVPKEHPHLRPLLVISTAWLVFVLVLFSIVTTKLPHYSASIYVPLSFVVAFCLERLIDKKLSVNRWIVGFFLMLGTLFSVLLLLFPTLMDNHFIKQGIVFEIQWLKSYYLPGIGFFLGIVVACILFWRRRIWFAAWVTALAMFFGTQGVWRVHVPVYLQYVQKPLLDLVQEAHIKNGKVVFYRLVSFAALFYGKRPIEMLHTYKFPGHPQILNSKQEQDLFVITERKHKKSLKNDHPLVQFSQDLGTYSLFILPRSSEKR